MHWVGCHHLPKGALLDGQQFNIQLQIQQRKWQVKFHVYIFNANRQISYRNCAYVERNRIRLIRTWWKSYGIDSPFIWFSTLSNFRNEKLSLQCKSHYHRNQVLEPTTVQFVSFKRISCYMMEACCDVVWLISSIFRRLGGRIDHSIHLAFLRVLKSNIQSTRWSVERINWNKELNRGDEDTALVNWPLTTERVI